MAPGTNDLQTDLEKARELLRNQRAVATAEAWREELGQTGENPGAGTYSAFGGEYVSAGPASRNIPSERPAWKFQPGRWSIKEGLLPVPVWPRPRPCLGTNARIFY